ncbi:MAG: rhodanese-like domain-containing protein [Hyphomicrobiaceae bacterium]|nr:rhodanese-like domain-containing protein [Hyphomicrobiaceae bacterium]
MLTVEEAHRRALKGELVLIDIRRPSEWRHTGLPASGHAISMYQGGMQFLVGVLQAAGGDRSKPIALICATGARSAYIQGVLRRHGFSAVSNVAAGMEGGRYGRGWVRSGLPVRPWTGRNAAPTSPAR